MNINKEVKRKEEIKTMGWQQRNKNVCLPYVRIQILFSFLFWEMTAYTVSFVCTFVQASANMDLESLCSICLFVQVLESTTRQLIPVIFAMDCYSYWKKTSLHNPFGGKWWLLHPKLRDMSFKCFSFPSQVNPTLFYGNLMTPVCKKHHGM